MDQKNHGGMVFLPDFTQSLPRAMQCTVGLLPFLFDLVVNLPMESSKQEAEGGSVT